MTTNMRKSLRRGSMPINDYIRRGSLGMGILELNNRRGMYLTGNPNIIISLSYQVLCPS